MKRTFFVFLNFIFCILPFTFLAAQNLAGYQKLRGEIIATTPDDDYTRHKYNAFDTNKGTSFMARDVNGWIGLDLGGSYAIRKLRVLPMADRHEQFEGTMLQGADNPEFNNAVTLFAAAGGLEPNAYGVFDITNPQAFRYVRCINPAHRISVAELEFYTDLDAQTVAYPQLTNLPTVYLETGGNYDFVNKSTYVTADVAVVENGVATVYPAQVRGRGNSTWQFMEKKPFRIKFDSKQHFLGLPANAKSWTLIALAVDKTLLRNGLAFEISKSLGFEFTPSCVMVDVMLDGFYYGTFMASDHIEINESRINIDEMKATDISGNKITGGYHLEIDAYAEEEPVHFLTPRRLPFTIKSPENDVQAQYQWIEDHIAATENLLFTNATAALEQYIDVESAVKYYIHSELTGNCDSYWCIPCYKKRGDDHLYFGPVWDYDQAFLTNERVPRYVETLNTQHGYAQPWFRRIMQTDTAQKVLHRIWKEEKSKNLKQRLIDYLNTNSANLQQSQALNFERWNSLNRKVWFEDALFNTYDEYIDFVRQFIEDRFEWFDGIAAERKALLPVSIKGDAAAQMWKYTLDTPANDWFTVTFNDSQWQQGQAPFGTERDLQNTLWTASQIFIRTQFEVAAADLQNLLKATFRVFHDEDVQIYLNGHPAFERSGYITDYQDFDFDKNLLQAGTNTLAVSCRQTDGGQFIDVGVYVTPENVPDVHDAVKSALADSKITWSVNGGTLYLKNLAANAPASLYGIDGKLLALQTARGGETQFTLPARGIYIVKINNEAIKVAY